jgi:hypothetical protein
LQRGKRRQAEDAKESNLETGLNLLASREKLMRQTSAEKERKEGGEDIAEEVKGYLSALCPAGGGAVGGMARNGGRKVGAVRSILPFDHPLDLLEEQNHLLNFLLDEGADKIILSNRNTELSDPFPS